MHPAYREWRQTEWFDSGFLQKVSAKQLKEFLQAFRPLSDEASTAVQNSLFAGIKKPWHYLHTTGWMKRLLHEGVPDRNISTLQQAVSAIRAKISWPDSELVLLVYHQPNVYVTTWGRFLHYFQRGSMNLDNLIVSHPNNRDVVLFWEGSNPYLGKRGRRELPCPPWDVK